MLLQIAKHWKFVLFEGIIFSVLGIVALLFPLFAALSLQILLGVLFLVAGFAQLFRIKALWQMPGSVSLILSSCLLVIVGLIFLFYPMGGLLSMTFLLALLFFVDGCFKLISSFRLARAVRSSWLVFSALLEILIAIIVWAGWPTSAVWFIGTLVGIHFFFAGITLISLALFAKNA